MCKSPLKSTSSKSSRNDTFPLPKVEFETANGKREKALLKLCDRRLAYFQRSLQGSDQWTPEVEALYRRYVLQGRADEQFADLEREALAKERSHGTNGEDSSDESEDSSDESEDSGDESEDAIASDETASSIRASNDIGTRCERTRRSKTCKAN